MHAPRARPAPLAALVLVAGLVSTAACGGTGSTTASPSTTAAGALPAARLALVAYSTPQAAYDRIIDAFTRTPAGRNITFTKSYGASGDQSRAVVSGLGADVVAFSLEPDMTRLVKAGLVAPGWNAGPDQGIVTKSVTVFVVRKGNPKNIRTWADLVKPGVEVITPNPFTSGGARWNVMAAYGQASRKGAADADGVAYLDRLFANVVVQDDSARKALQTFTSGKGDVMLAYENEAIFARRKGQAVDYVVPTDTILIENPVAVTSSSRYPDQAKAFVAFLRGPVAQAIFAGNGYRPVLAGVKSPTAFPTPAGLFDIAALGGWADVSGKFFDPAGGVMAGVEKRIGVSVG